MGEGGGGAGQRQTQARALGRSGGELGRSGGGDSLHIIAGGCGAELAMARGIQRPGRPPGPARGTMRLEERLRARGGSAAAA